MKGSIPSGRGPVGCTYRRERLEDCSWLVELSDLEDALQGIRLAGKKENVVIGRAVRDRAPTYRFPQVTRLAAPTAAAPWWRFEGTGLFLWSAPAKLLSRLVEDFIARNYDSLTTPVQR